MTRLVFLDTETTGLDPRRHRVWEVAYIIRDPGAPDLERTCFLDVPLEKSDPYALKVGHYYQRHPDPHRLGPGLVDAETIASAWETYGRLAEVLRDAVMCGFNPAFDAGFLAREMRRYGLAPTWHFRAHDITTMAGAIAGMPLPFNTARILERYAITVPAGHRHTALGDARAARDLFDALAVTPPGDAP